MTFSIIILFGFASSMIFEKIKLPGILGMLLSGILLSSFYQFEDKTLIKDIKILALIIIAIRAGLSIKKDDLKLVGLNAIKIGTIPSFFESVTVFLFSFYILKFDAKSSLLLGFILAAASPAIIIPAMIEYKKVSSKVSSLMLAGVSIDNILAMTLFFGVIGLTAFSVKFIINFPLSILLGVLAGLSLAFLLLNFFHKIHLRDSKKVILIILFSIFLIEIEKRIPFSSLVSIMTLGGYFLFKDEKLSERLAVKFSKLWILAEILLFSVIGLEFKLNIIKSINLYFVLLVILSVFARLAGVYISLYKSQFSSKDKKTAMVTFIPKATVQAALSSIPLTMGLPFGKEILAISILSILITLPIGSLMIKKVTNT